MPDSAELIVTAHLTRHGFADIRYEPDGNIPPDLLLDGKIATEVSRLVQHEDSSGATRGISETALPLVHGIERLLASFGPPRFGVTWWVTLRFRRPLPNWRSTQKEILSWLSEFASTERNSGAAQSFGESLELQLLQRPFSAGRMFELIMTTDRDSGGDLLSEVHRNLEICILRKSKKVRPYLSRYPEWWLAVTDQISIRSPGFDIRPLLGSPPSKEVFSRVLIFNAWDPARFLQY